MTGPAPVEPDLLDELDRLIATLDANPDPQVREQVASLLRGIDAVHRTALTHLVATLHAMGGDALLNRVIADPAIRLLLMSYDLLAVDRRLQAEEALDSVRGHLHAHGIDVELTDVVGGVVTVRIHGITPASDAPTPDRRPTIDAVLHDVEEALKEGFLGFQELVLSDRAHDRSAPIVPVSLLRKPVYRSAARLDDILSTGLLGVDVDGEPVLIARCEAEVFAVRNRCGDSPLPLNFGTLTGTELRCSWHNCRYDLRTGRRLDAEGERLRVFPVAVEDNEVRIAIGTAPPGGA